MSVNIKLYAKYLIGVIVVIATCEFIYITFKRSKLCESGECRMKIDLGVLLGRQRETILNRKVFYSFQGIPYAKPPVGPLRFKDPEPIKSWNTVIDATKEGSICLQSDLPTSEPKGELIGSEDCLYLNIYTSQSPGHDITRQPVIVYFHGGGFTFGSGSEYIFGADYLIENDVVVVTLNYRIGALGFLSLNNDDIPGNAGLKDQVLALKWVQEHISYFGGDPNNVMICGSSAGAASVQYHMISPLSKGLFHSAVMLSGSVLNPWAFDENPMQKALHFGKILGLNTSDVQELAFFLKLKSSEVIVKNQDKIKTEEDLMRCTSFPFLPSVEKPSQNSFLVENPRTLLETGQFSLVPTIIGTVKKEGLLAYHRDDLLKYFNDDMGRFVPHDLHLQRNSAQFQDVKRRIREFYFHNMSLSLDRPDDFVDICGDVEFVLGLQDSIGYFLINSTIPIYVEKFTFRGQFGFEEKKIKKIWPSLNIPDGPSHGDEIPYIFYMKGVEKLPDISDEIKIVRLFSSLLTNTAIYHNPNRSNKNIIWKPTEQNNPSYLVLGKSIDQVGDNLLTKEKMEFWKKIYKIVKTQMNN